MAQDAFLFPFFCTPILKKFTTCKETKYKFKTIALPHSSYHKDIEQTKQTIRTRIGDVIKTQLREVGQRAAARVDVYLDSER